MFKKKKDQTYQSYWSISWNIFKKNKVAMVCLFIVILLCLIALFAPLIAPYDPNKQVLTDRLMKPCGQHWFGTDDLGRDIFSRIIYGCRVSLSVGIISQIIATVIGYTMGVCAGYFGGKVDMFLMRFTDIFLALPSMLLMVVLNTILRPGLFTLIAVLSLFSWAQVARITRAETMSVKERDYVTAARNLGAGSFRIAVEHIVPNIMGPVIVAASLGIANAILMESSLSFLGLGVQIPRASWGSMLQSAQGHILDAPRLAVFPGVLILCTVLSFNLLGDVLRTALEPKIVK